MLSIFSLHHLQSYFERMPCRLSSRLAIPPGQYIYLYNIYTYAYGGVFWRVIAKKPISLSLMEIFMRSTRAIRDGCAGSQGGAGFWLREG
jgi:hypothetical protein